MAMPNGVLTVDTVINGRWVLPVLPSEHVVLENHSVVINDGEILDVVPHNIARQRYNASAVLERTSHVIMPGLINAHTHTGMTTMRGRADDKPLLEWLRGSVWPIEHAFITEPKFCEDGALLAAAEMTRGGVTTLSDMYWFPDASARAALKSGMRAVIGMIVIAFPSSYAANTAQYFEVGHEVQKKYASESLLTFCYAPHAPYTVQDETWKVLRKRSVENGFRIHTHLHETKDECTSSAVLDRNNPACHMSDSKMHPLRNLDEMGILSNTFIAAHMTQLTDDEIALCAERGVHVAHCPTSNAKLASGYCEVGKLLQAGVNVALGTDSACSNNSLDMFAEMKLAALAAKNLAEDATAVPAPAAIQMATINGARALGIDHVTGSLCPGKRADVICVELGTHSGNSPVFNVQSAIVYAASRHDVSDVFVDGVCTLRNKKLTRLDEKQMVKRAQYWADKINERFPPN